MHTKHDRSSERTRAHTHTLTKTVIRAKTASCTSNGYMILLRVEKLLPYTTSTARKRMLKNWNVKEK